MPAVGSVIIVTFNSALHIESCLRSLNDPDWGRIVVDNASTDASVDRARAVPGTLVFANRQNRGFAAAANQGARAACGNLLLFLNPDVVVQAGALAALRQRAQATAAGAVAGRLLHPDGRTQVGFSVRRLPTLVSALALELLLLNRIWPNNPLNRYYRCLDFDYEQPAEIEQPAGACLLVKRSVWEKLGGFDERFFPLWFEDVDFCQRLRAAGWKIVYEPQARFLHIGGHSVATLSQCDRQLYWYQNLLRYFHKHRGPAAVAAVRGGILMGMLLRMLATILGANLDGDNRRTRLEAYAHVIRRCVLSRSIEA